MLQPPCAVFRALMQVLAGCTTRIFVPLVLATLVAVRRTRHRCWSCFGSMRKSSLLLVKNLGKFCGNQRKTENLQVEYDEFFLAYDEFDQTIIFRKHIV